MSSSSIHYQIVSQKNTERAKNRHLQNMQEGQNIALKMEPLHLKACMLYWAEGSKGTKFSFTNCDIEMHKIMMDFLKIYFPETLSQIRGWICYYPNPNLTYPEIEAYWRQELGITHFIKPSDRSKYYSQPKNVKYPFGIFRIELSSRRILYHIYGAINQYINKEVFKP